MKKTSVLLYSGVCYLVAFTTLLYLIVFVEGWNHQFIPRTVDAGGVVGDKPVSLAIDLGLLLLFAVQHSGMARRAFKAFWTRVLVPKSVERSTYILFASLCLIVLFAFWRPIPEVVWSIENRAAANAVVALSLLGWAILFTATFLINHFELFGLQQAYSHFKDVEMKNPSFRTPLYYRFVRHPIYFGLVLAMFAAPTMTMGRLVFSAVGLAYILVGIYFEERDLVDIHGDQYVEYRSRVRMLIPIRRGK